jgi:hypothetical protein
LKIIKGTPRKCKDKIILSTTLKEYSSSIEVLVHENVLHLPVASRLARSQRNAYKAIYLFSFIKLIIAKNLQVPKEYVFKLASRLASS